MITAEDTFEGNTIDLNNFLSKTRTVNAKKLTKSVKIIGNDKNNLLKGGSSDDTLTAGVGKDTLTGGNGNDTFIFTAEGNATITDYSSNDTVKIEGTITSTSTNNDDLIYTVDNHSLTIKRGASKTINLINDNKFIETDFNEIMPEKITNDVISINTAETNNTFKVQTDTITFTKNKNK